MEKQYRTISVLIDKKKLEFIKKLLKSIRIEYPDLKVISPKLGSIKDKVLFSFKIEANYYNIVAESFTTNSIDILTIGAKKQLIENFKKDVQKPMVPKQEKLKEGWSDLIKKKDDTPSISIEELINKGEYKRLIKLSKDIHLGSELRKFAAKSIGSAANILIGRLFQRGTLANDGPEEYIRRLLQIGRDKELKHLGEDSLRKTSVEKAVDLTDYFKEDEKEEQLVKICNDRGLHNHSNIYAALKLAEIVFESREKTISQYIRKNLNLRWLRIAYDAKPRKFPQESDQKIKMLIKTIEKGK